ncbi:glucose-6-phosphate isomerase [Oscillibacter hominis]|uniref:Glucose-6-phosphate isomerase n=1 Tax=Oscillibacter hominis TaxID=2763056 RepID=A0A7G9B3J7_9FIRM|nr:glucose-6-phosphate isomerase [Oscillibacter hominis]QNL44128.1 glucose-6-phosphate isomerase [Oscillibacter hominis]
MLNVRLFQMKSFIPMPYEEALAPRLKIADQWLQSGSGKGGEFTGWVNLPRDYDREEFDRIRAAAKKIQSDSKALVVIGIGGSYLGARGVIECLCSPNYNLKKKDTPNVYFVGNGLSGDALYEVMELIGGQDFSVNVISKSGTTTEPAVAFRFFRERLVEKYGAAGADRRIYATTDKARGALKSLADRQGWETFVVPDEVGGRYSVLTAVGLLPIAVCGVDISGLMAGAAEMMEVCRRGGSDCPAWRYAAARFQLYHTGKKVEILGSFDPSFRFMAEWWKQLYGESEGKEGKGIFPASVEFTADLHSMGQYIQQGERILFETVVRMGPSGHPMAVPRDESDGDGLNFLAGRDMDFIRDRAMEGTLLAHSEGGVPNLIVETEDKSPRSLGQLIYFFEYACGLSGYLLGVNPFDQPGVESYKKNMFALLGKPGYEELAGQLKARLENQ